MREWLKLNGECIGVDLEQHLIELTLILPHFRRHSETHNYPQRRVTGYKHAFDINSSGDLIEE